MTTHMVEEKEELQLDVVDQLLLGVNQLLDTRQERRKRQTNLLFVVVMVSRRIIWQEV
jgi:hypothetical protein